MATIVENNNNKNENTTIPLTKIQEEFFTAIENGDIKTVEKILSSKDSTSSVPANFQNPNNGTRSSSATTTSDVVVDDGIPLNDINLDEEEK